ncbi:hypothetical protein EDC96DRAFT_274290 [Choanephora cucurbitarum]|nr:hypothetical protein EDC96DRAFT_274290 [Choanephora cucurbitarum]
MMTSTFSIDEECCDRLRTALEITDVEKDMTHFVNKYATGSSLPQPMVCETLYDPALLVQTTPSTSIHSLMDKKRLELQNHPHQESLQHKVEQTEQTEQPRSLPIDEPRAERIVLTRNTGSNLTNPDEELKSIDHQLQKIEIQNTSLDMLSDQPPQSSQSNDKAYKEVEQMLSSQPQEKTVVDQATPPSALQTAYTQDSQPLLGEFSTGIYHVLGLKDNEGHAQHNPVPSVAQEATMVKPTDEAKTDKKYQPKPNPGYHPNTDQPETTLSQPVANISPRGSSLLVNEQKLLEKPTRANGHYSIEENTEEEGQKDGEYQSRIPKLPTKDEKWVISSIRRPQQLPVKTQHATMYDGSVRSSSIISNAASPVPHKQLDEVETKHQPKVHKPVVPLTIEIPNAVKTPADMAQQIIQEGRKQIKMSPVPGNGLEQHPNGVPEENGMGIRPAPWQEEFKSNDHVIKNAGYRGPPMMATNTNAAMPAAAYYSYQQPARASVFRQEPHSHEPQHDDGANKKRFGAKNQLPSNTKQNGGEATLKTAATNLKDKEKGRFSLGFFGGNKKEKKKEKEAAANAAVIASYQQQQPRPTSQVIYAGSHESFDSSNVTKQSNAYAAETRFISYAKAQWPFEATIEGEMSFHQDEVLGVIRKQTDGWWEAERIGAVNPGQRGLIPGNYMQDNYPPPTN